MMNNYFCSKQIKILTALFSIQNVTDTHQTRPHVGSKTTNTIQGINYFLRIAVNQLRILLFLRDDDGLLCKKVEKNHIQ